MKRMEDLGITPKVKRVEVGYNTFEGHTIDESNRPISFNVGFVPVKMVKGQNNLKYGDSLQNMAETGLDLTGFFINSENNQYQRFLDGTQKSFDSYGIFLVGLTALGCDCFMIGSMQLEKDSNGKPIITNCTLSGFNGNDYTGGYLEISNGIITLGVYAK